MHFHASIPEEIGTGKCVQIKLTQQKIRMIPSGKLSTSKDELMTKD